MRCNASQATELLAEARQKIGAAQKENDQKAAQKLQDEGFLALFRSYKALPKNKPLIKYLSEDGIKRVTAENGGILHGQQQPRDA